jgi:hypothetical protein
MPKTSVIGFTEPYKATQQWYVGVTFSRTATGSGIGTSTATAIELLYRTASGSGAGTQTATAIKILSRSATGSGVSGSSSYGSKSSTRMATGSGNGTGSVTGLITRYRNATGTSSSSQYASAIEIIPRTATGSGAGATSGDASGYKFHMFRPPTRFDGPTTLVNGDRVANRLARFYRPRERGRNVYQLVDLTFTEVDQANYDVVLKVYHGGHVHELTEGEYTDLLAAGYSAYLT